MIKALKAQIKKLTLFDKLLVFLFISAVLFVGFLLFRKAIFITVVAKVGEENVVYDPWLRDAGVRSWFSQLFYTGMKETDGLSRVTAEVTSVRSYDTQPARKAVYLTLKVRAVYNRASNQYTYKGKALLVGSPIKFNLDRLSVGGLVTYVEGVKDYREIKTLLVDAKLQEDNPSFLETNGVESIIADAIKVGDIIKDDQGNDLIEVIFKRVENARRLVITNDGRTLVGNNPLRKDVYLTLKIQAKKINDRYYIFDDSPLLVGGGIPINTDTFSLPIENSQSSISLKISSIKLVE